MKRSLTCKQIQAETELCQQKSKELLLEGDGEGLVEINKRLAELAEAFGKASLRETRELGSANHAHQLAKLREPHGD